MQHRQAPPGWWAPSQWVIVKPRGADHRTRCSRSVHALKTRLKGASKMRVMTSSRSAVPAAALAFFAAMSLPLHLQLAQIILQAIEALLPEPAIVLQPVG